MSRYNNQNSHRFETANNHKLGLSFSNNPIKFENNITVKIEEVKEQIETHAVENIYNETFTFVEPIEDIEPIEIEDNRLQHLEYINEIKNDIEEEKIIPVVPEQDFTEDNSKIKKIIKQFNLLKTSKTNSKKV